MIKSDLCLKISKEQEFNNVFNQYFDSLVKFAITIVNNQEVAEDIVQESFIKLWEDKAKLSEIRSLKPYLLVSIRNRCIRFITSKKEKNTIDDINIEHYDLYNFELIEKSEKYKDLFLAIEQIPIKARIVFKLICFENLKYKEVASDLGISVNTVKHHFSKTLKTLRNKFNKDNFILFFRYFKKK